MKIAILAALLSMGAIPARAQQAGFVPGQFDFYVLALTWEPTFCDWQPASAGCQDHDPGRYDASHLSLHGFWPNRIGDARHDYGMCGVDPAVEALDDAAVKIKPSDFHALPELALSDSTQAELAARMPGYAAALERHEWYKHGTCSGLAADDYFRAADSLVDEVAASSLGRYLAANAGRTVPLSDLVGELQADYPQGYGDVVLRCSKVAGVDALSEVWFYLKKSAPQGGALASLLTPSDAPAPGTCPASVLLYKN